MKEKRRASQNQVYWGNIAEKFVLYRLKKQLPGTIKQKFWKYYDLINIYGNLKNYHERKIEVKACQLFSKFNGSNKNVVGNFKAIKINHINLVKEKGLYVFVYMYRSKVLFAISVDAKVIDKLPKRYFLIRGRRKQEYFNIKASFFIDKQVKVI